jgi:hypothetical protein
MLPNQRATDKMWSQRLKVWSEVKKNPSINEQRSAYHRAEIFAIFLVCCLQWCYSYVSRKKLIANKSDRFHAKLAT